MKCPKCNTENLKGASYCKRCGTDLSQNSKICKNGHNYDASLDECPFCPSYGSKGSYAETVFDSGVYDRDKTVIDVSSPQLKPAGGHARPDMDRTMIYSSQPASVGSSGAREPQAGIRKLVGWLVTYDINPAGTDYKLYVGRQLIGRRASNDIVLQQPGVSEDHAIILYRDDKLVIQDNLSTNGTYVNGKSIEERTELLNDDIIKVGTIELKVKII